MTTTQTQINRTTDMDISNTCAMTKKSSWLRFVSITLVCVLAMFALLISGCGNKVDAAGKHHVTMEVEGYSPVTIELDGDAAPETVQNFLDLVGKGYYNGKSFYRVVDNFCLQGGAGGQGDSKAETIVGEFSSNGHDNKLADHFDVGTVAMARSSNPDSASTEFFVTLGDNNAVGISLDGQYAAFGTIDQDGMETINQIVQAALPNAGGQMGMISNSSKQPVITKMEVVD